MLPPSNFNNDQLRINGATPRHHAISSVSNMLACIFKYSHIYCNFYNYHWCFSLENYFFHIAAFSSSSGWFSIINVGGNLQESNCRWTLDMQYKDTCWEFWYCWSVEHTLRNQLGEFILQFQSQLVRLKESSSCKDHFKVVTMTMVNI
jgi:hypothetical protein